MASNSPIPWEQVVPSARTTSPQSITRQKVLEMVHAGKKPGVDFLLIDVRREDHLGSSISGSLNMPIQTLHQSLPTLYRLCEAAAIKHVIFYCGHSTGRGPRAAALFHDEIKENGGDFSITSVVLEDGFNGWSTAGGGFDEFVTPQTM